MASQENLSNSPITLDNNDNNNYAPTLEEIQKDWYNTEFAPFYNEHYTSNVLKDALLGFNKHYNMEQSPWIIYLKPLDKNRNDSIVIHKILENIAPEITKDIEYKLFELNYITYIFNDCFSANALLDLEEIRLLGWIAFIPEFKLKTQVIIELPLKNNLKEITEEIKSNENVPEILKVTEIPTKKSTLKKLSIDFKGNSAPEKLKIFDNIYETSLSKVQLRRCTNCQIYGHYKTHCRRPTRCYKCGKNHKSCKRVKNFRCVNCSLNHMASDKSCDIYKNNMKIIEVMQTTNFSFRQAKIYLEQKEKSSKLDPSEVCGFLLFEGEINDLVGEALNDVYSDMEDYDMYDTDADLDSDYDDFYDMNDEDYF